MVSNNFPFRLSKFSKYVEGIQLTFRWYYIFRTFII
jgi:hypothetical protein